MQVPEMPQIPNPPEPNTFYLTAVRQPNREHADLDYTEVVYITEDGSAIYMTDPARYGPGEWLEPDHPVEGKPLTPEEARQEVIAFAEGIVYGLKDGQGSPGRVFLRLSEAYNPGGELHHDTDGYDFVPHPYYGSSYTE